MTGTAKIEKISWHETVPSSISDLIFDLRRGGAEPVAVLLSPQKWDDYCRSFGPFAALVNNNPGWIEGVRVEKGSQIGITILM